ncbi:uncharacterized protein LOC122795006 [Protopterus annectens]|uniref:uncharacterized protein LOC122795006 n=1 Tax=Protopterus annectens TaxID=7888 RepID=UPI001CFC12B7|nr:uncharacterized protein LOC122795006 [Protopterus annectens]
MKYHFKSIETWLDGVCVSHCSEHMWGSKPVLPGKKSIFYLNNDDELSEEAMTAAVKETVKNKQLQNERDSDRSEMEKKRRTFSESEKGQTVTEENGLKNIVVDIHAKNNTLPQDCVNQTESSNYCKENEGSKTYEGNVDVQLNVEKTMNPKSEAKGAKAEEPEGGNSAKYSEIKVDSDKNDKEVKASFKTAHKTAPKKKEMKGARQGGRQQQAQKLTARSPAACLSGGPDSSDSESSDDARTGGNKSTQKSFLMGLTRDSFDPHGNREKKFEDPKGTGPFFYIGGGNGAAM